jgi:hypothetical protein
MTQQEKMKARNTKAGEKKGDERKAFMSDCLAASRWGSRALARRGVMKLTPRPRLGAIRGVTAE